MNIKWRRMKPYVYRSVREIKTEIKTDATGQHKAFEKPVVTSEYLGTYQKHREERPNGDYTGLVPNETILRWMAKFPERLSILHAIDAAVHLDFERKQLSGK